MSASAIATSRVCPATGRRIFRQAEGLIRANAVVAVVSLLIGAIAALLLVLTRWQAVHLLPATWYYRLLGVHGMNMLIFFIIYFEMAVLWFAATVLLNARPAAPRFGWFNFGTMLVGTLMVEWAQWSGNADVLFTSYPPLKAHPVFYLGVILFAVGALLVTAQFFATLVIAKRERTYEGSVPLVVYGAITAAIIAVITLVHGALVYIPTFLWSIGLTGPVDPQVYRMLWWALGHSSQQINVAAMVAIWYMLGGLTVGAVVLNEKVSRTAFVLYILFISMASAHHLLVDPGFSPAWKIVNTSYFMYMAVLASMVHGFTVPAGIELGMRLRGFTSGLFGWLRRAPWGDPGFSSLVLSVIVFGFVGGITGVTLGTEQINIIAHNTMRIPGHFHSTVVSGTALAFMGATYYLLPLIFRRKVAFWPLARIQPYLFSGGLLLLVMGMTFAGSFGVPRRHWDISFSQAPFDVPFNPAVDLFLAVMGIGGILAVTGALIFIAIAVKSVFFGEPVHDIPRGAPVRGLPAGLTNPPVHAANVDEINEQLHAPARGIAGATPGTLVLVAVFLLAFMLYYFTNWKLLSFLWKIG
ncbi:MAG: cbb3-type cytochrome c oxidase subunit I [Gemmatimonadetes bacterium]|nr:cbb3-type cytochrome c oxidase subunit I [Gemmatimonadota bacterium]MCA9763819.1 cbb3-type cytochrome c oxidase subunit I [Gemmatimonadota bacterium]MCA9768755.1 cbb3-type cytochrome c oxidase subunit I [Gemmatimonadota bacterium]MCB9517991.1 cbb3-type cytochrome c oxidase subunit I [Gemmatimonadales bacterium]HPE12614.1 cbb3-type cytochrome c oxidase subunit I [Actinomycetota bacterium]